MNNDMTKREEILLERLIRILNEKEDDKKEERERKTAVRIRGIITLYG